MNLNNNIYAIKNILCNLHDTKGFDEIAELMNDIINRELFDNIQYYVIENVENLKSNIVDREIILEQTEANKLIELLTNLIDNLVNDSSMYDFKFIPIKIECNYKIIFSVDLKSIVYESTYIGNNYGYGKLTTNYIFNEEYSKEQQDTLKMLFDKEDLINTLLRFADDYTYLLK